MTESNKTHQERIEYMQRFKAAYNKAKKKGLVQSRPIIINDPPLGENK